MATYYFRNSGNSSWNVSTNWSLSSGGPANGSVPGNSDVVIFDSNSGACSTTSGAVCGSLQFNTYTNTITFSNQLNIWGSAGITITGNNVNASGSSAPALSGTSVTQNLTSNSFSWNGNMIAGNGCIVNITDTWIITGSFTNACDINGGNLTLSGNLTINTYFGGSSNFIFNGTSIIIFAANTDYRGTGDWSFNTSGTITFDSSNPITFLAVNGNQSISYTSGTIVTTGSTVIFAQYSSHGITFNNISSVIFNNVQLQFYSASFTLNSDMYISGTLELHSRTFNAGGNINGSNIYTGGLNFSNSLPLALSGTVAGTSTIYAHYGGTWTAGTSTVPINNNIILDCSSYTTTFTNNFTYSAGKIQYLSGTIVTTGSTLILRDSSSSVDTNTIVWNNISVSGTITLYSDLYCNNFTGNGGVTVNGNYFCHVFGNLIDNTGAGVISGSAGFIMCGTGSININGSFRSSSLEINTAGTITLTSAIFSAIYQDFIFTYTQGTIITSSTVVFSVQGHSMYINGTSNCTFSNVQFNLYTNAQFILNSDLNVSGAFTVYSSNSYNGTINGYNINCGSLTFNAQPGSYITGSATIVLKYGGTFTGSSNMLVSNNIIFDSSSNTTTLSGTISYQGVVSGATSGITYTSGTINSGTSSLIVYGPSVLDTGGMQWHDVLVDIPHGSTGVNIPITLKSNLNSTGTFKIGGGVYQAAVFVNGYTINVANLTSRDSSTNVLAGTSSITAKYGGTWTFFGNAYFTHSGGFIFDSGSNTVTISSSGSQLRYADLIGGQPIYNASFTYTSGKVLLDNTSIMLSPDGTLTMNNCDKLTFWNLQLDGGTVTLNSDIYVDCTLTIGVIGTSHPIVNGYNIYLGRNRLGSFYNANAGGGSVSGTTKIVFSGCGQGTWTNNNRTLTFNNDIIFNFNGTLTFYDNSGGSGFFSLGSGTYTYKSGILRSKDGNGKEGGILLIPNSCTLIDWHRIACFKYISISNGVTLTMNKFFNGRPKLITNVQVNTSGTYNITFTDGFEKLAKFVKISSCNIVKPGQLLALSIDSNGGLNKGIRYSNQSPNGIPKRDSTIPEFLSGSDINYRESGLLAEPAISIFGR